MARDRLLAFARDLERRDEALAEALAAAGELQREADALRGRAEAVAAVLSRGPEDVRAAAAAVAEAEDELARRRGEAERAEHELAAAEEHGDVERVAAARRAVVRTRDAARMGEGRVRRAVEHRDELERELAAAGREAPELAERARSLAGRLGALPRASRGAAEPPGPGLDAVVAWAARAQAALFVVRAGLETERERVVREANELAAAALGESLGSTGVALVRERLERVLASG